MARAQRPQVYTETLPPVKVTPEMRAAVTALADRSGLSVADVVRDALEAKLAPAE
jgi:Ribbon-helix-helix protein, copG family